MSNQSELSEDEIRERLREACEASGGVTKWASENSVPQPYVSTVLSGRQQAGPMICRALGYRMKRVYVPDAWDEPTPDAWQKGSK